MPDPAVIFDIGGVLVRCRWDAPACRPLVEKIGGPNADIFLQFTAEGMFSRLNSGEMTPDEFAGQAIARFGLELDIEAFRAAWTGIFSPMDGMAELFDAVAARHPVTVLSDTDPWHWEKLRIVFPALAALEKPILSFAQGLVKPAPGLYRAAAAAVGRDCGDCVFVDDRQPNVDGARAAGMQGIRFESAEQVRAELAALGVVLS